MSPETAWPIFYAHVDDDGGFIEISPSRLAAWSEWKMRLAGQDVIVRVEPRDPAVRRKSKVKEREK